MLPSKSRAQGTKRKTRNAGHGKQDTGHSVAGHHAPSGHKSPGSSGTKGGTRETAAVLKELERAVLSIKYYPVAVKEDAKNAALERLKKDYRKGSDSVRQHMLFLIHENIATVSDMKSLQTYETAKAKAAKPTPGALRMSVYSSMFNYNTSIEGISELILLLGEFRGGGDEAAKLLTHLFSHFCAVDNEANRFLRNAVIEAMGRAESTYALRALLGWTRLTDSEKLLGRLASALLEWGERIDKLDLPAHEKHKFKEELQGIQEMMTKEEVPTQYG